MDRGGGTAAASVAPSVRHLEEEASVSPLRSVKSAGDLLRRRADASEQAPALEDRDIASVHLLRTVECPICLDVMFKSRVGACGHSFCSSCIESFVAQVGEFKCPICRGYYGKVEERPTNILANSLIQQYFPFEWERKRKLRSREGGGVKLVLRRDENGAPLLRAAPVAEGVIVRRSPLRSSQHRAALPFRMGASVFRALWRRFVDLIRPFWPVLKWLLPAAYPMVVLLLYFLWVMKSSRRTRKHKVFSPMIHLP